MNQPLVYDATALLALFRGHPIAYHYWRRADRREVGLASLRPRSPRRTGGCKPAGAPGPFLIWPERIDVAPLDTSAALDSAGFAGGLATAQVIREAHHLGGAVLTARPQDYHGLSNPVITL